MGEAVGQKRGEASIKDDGVVISLQRSNNENLQWQFVLASFTINVALASDNLGHN